MKASTLGGALLAAAVILGGGAAALAAKRKKDEEPFFLYTVQPGDTLSALALRFFGDAAKWPTLSDKETVAAGTTLRVPCLWVAVRPGDTLAKIAAENLGDAGRWRRIYEANRRALPDPNRLNVGQRLAVPMAEAPAAAWPLGPAPSWPYGPAATSAPIVNRPAPDAIGELDLDLLGAECLP